VQEEGQPELAPATRYGVQQVIILIPLLVIGIALVQEYTHRHSGPRGADGYS
jgi:hypothetical protein